MATRHQGREHQASVERSLRASNYGDRLRIGLLVPCRNTIAEPDFNAMAPAGVSFHVHRLRLLGTSRQQLLEMAQDVEQAAMLLSAARVDLIAFHCTAASTLDGSFADEVIERIERVTGLPAVATSSGLLAALAQLKAQRIALLTPYEQHINESEIAFIQANGIHVTSVGGLTLPDAQSMAAVDPEQWLRLATALPPKGADAYFLSCTNIRVTPILGRLEQSTGIPVIASNQVMLWHCLRKAGISDQMAEYGRLLHDH